MASIRSKLPAQAGDPLLHGPLLGGKNVDRPHRQAAQDRQGDELIKDEQNDEPRPEPHQKGGGMVEQGGAAHRVVRDLQPLLLLPGRFFRLVSRGLLLRRCDCKHILHKLWSLPCAWRSFCQMVRRIPAFSSFWMLTIGWSVRVSLPATRSLVLSGLSRNSYRGLTR